MTDDAERFEHAFRLMAEQEFALSSPLYERLAYELADRFDLTSPLARAPIMQQTTLLYFAAIGYVLRTSADGHPLARWMPTLGGTRPAGDGEPLDALADLVTAHRAEIEHLCATRRTQTNEAARAALLRPAFGRAAELIGGQPMELVEIGTSAGLLLAVDRYAYRYRDAAFPSAALDETSGSVRLAGAGTFDARQARDETFGRGALTIDCEIRGAGWPAPAGTPLPIASRTGIDLGPIRWDDADAVAWLHACIWPEHAARTARLDAALAEVATVRPTFFTGDIVTALPEVLAAVDPAGVPVVFGSHVMQYLSPESRDEIVRTIDTVGRGRELIAILNEGANMLAANWFTPDAPRPGSGVRTQVTIVHFRDGETTVEVQAEGGAHGAWLDFNPKRYAYAPPALAL
jgi:hypothetical protein